LAPFLVNKKSLLLITGTLSIEGGTIQFPKEVILLALHFAITGGPSGSTSVKL
jgi:hypothetical protein